MNRDEYNRLFHELELNLVAFKQLNDCDQEVLKLVNAAIAAEREACAKVCDEQGNGRKAMEHYAALTYAKATHDCAAAIRARGEQ